VSDPALHPDAERLAFLLGTWAGEGEGEYPTIEPFTYREEVRFWHVGKPFLAYSQRTWHGGDGRPLHGESGYWRPVGEDRVELVVAHPNGIVEVAEGTSRGTRIELATTAVARTSSAKHVAALERSVEVEGDVLRYTLRMGAVGVPLTHHLRAALVRAGDGR
jgi:hypothetical protein